MGNQADQKNIAGLMQPYLIEKDGQKYLTCKKAFELAETHDLKLSEMVTVCNLEMIRISGCQLGCFK